MQTSGQVSKQPENEDKKIPNRSSQTIFFHNAQDNHGKFFLCAELLQRSTELITDLKQLRFHRNVLFRNAFQSHSTCWNTKFPF